MSNYVEWSMQGLEYSNCNCGWGCPCQFNGPPTLGNCRAFCFVQIDRGHFDGTPLDGLRWGILAAWPAAIHLGNGRLQTIVDEAADANQRKAIETISHGGETEPGSLIWQVFSTTVTEFLPTVHRAIDLKIDYAARKAAVKVAGVIEGTGETIKNPMTGAAHQVRVTIPNGFEFTESEFISGRAMAGAPIELNFDGTHAHMARIHWSTRGVVR